MSEGVELTPVESSRLELSNCPGCDTQLEISHLALNEETTCPHCGVVILLVRIDGVKMFLRDGWT